MLTLVHNQQVSGKIVTQERRSVNMVPQKWHCMLAIQRQGSSARPARYSLNVLRDSPFENKWLQNDIQLIFNIICRISTSTRPFMRIILAHFDPSTAPETMDSVSDTTVFDPAQETLAVLEDLNRVNMRLTLIFYSPSSVSFDSNRATAFECVRSVE